MAEQSESHVILMFGKTLALGGQFNGPTNLNPCSANVWQNDGFPWAVSWVEENDPNIRAMCFKTVTLHGQFYGSINVNHI